MDSPSPDDGVAAMDVPPRPSPPINVSAGSAQETGSGTDVDRGSAAPPVQDTPRHGTAAATVRALYDDDPPLPLLHVVDPDKETEGPQLHDGPPGPPSFPSEFDDSLAKQVENDLERQLPDYDGASTVQSASRPDVADTSAVGPSTVEGVEEGNVSSRGATPSARSHTPAVSATAHVGLDLPSAGRSNIVVEAYRVEEVEEAPGGGTVYAEVAIVPFYLRKGFVSIMIAVTLLAIGIAVLAVVLLSNNMGGNGGTKTSSDGALFPVPGSGGAAPQTSPPWNDPVAGQAAPLATTSVASSDPTKTLTSSPSSNVSQGKEPRTSKVCQIFMLSRKTIHHLLFFSPRVSRQICLPGINSPGIPSLEPQSGSILARDAQLTRIAKPVPTMAAQ